MTAPNKTENVKAPCTHYDDCGGCSMQHIEESRYYEIKNSIIENIVERYGDSNTEILGIIKIPGRSRRRVDFKIQIKKQKDGAKDLVIGFNKHQSHEITAINDCLVADKEFSKIIPNLKRFINESGKTKLFQGVAITKLNKGLDAIFKLKKRVKFDSESLKDFTNENQIYRLSTKIDDQLNVVIKSEEDPSIKVSGLDIKIPNETFLQATEQGQEAIIEFIKSNLSIDTEKSIADLYCGMGTYSLPLLANGYFLSSYESGDEMIFSLTNNAKRLGFENIISAEIRDLFKAPLPANQINNFDAVIINPPRAGAKEQIVEIAKSKINKIIYISCDRKTFERDLQLLTKAGFKLSKIQGIDQFLWSKHIEIAALIEKI